MAPPRPRHCRPLSALRGGVGEGPNRGLRRAPPCPPHCTGRDDELLLSWGDADHMVDRAQRAGWIGAPLKPRTTDGDWSIHQPGGAAGDAAAAARGRRGAGTSPFQWAPRVCPQWLCRRGPRTHGEQPRNGASEATRGWPPGRRRPPRATPNHPRVPRLGSLRAPTTVGDAEAR